MPNLTDKVGCNPAARLRARYDQLMRISCVNQLASEATTAAYGTGFSPRNQAKFNRDLAQAKARGLDSVKFFLTNFVLAADGLRVIQPGRN